MDQVTILAKALLHLILTTDIFTINRHGVKRLNIRLSPPLT